MSGSQDTGADPAQLDVRGVEKLYPEVEGVESSATLKELQQESPVLHKVGELYNEEEGEKSEETIRKEVTKKWDKILAEEQSYEQERNHSTESVMLKAETMRAKELLEAMMEHFQFRHVQFQSTSEAYSLYLKNLVALFDRWLDDTYSVMKEGWNETIRDYETYQQEMDSQHGTSLQSLLSESLETQLQQDNIAQEELNCHEERIQEIKVRHKEKINAIQAQLESKKMTLEGRIKELESKYKQVLEAKKYEYDSVIGEHEALDDNIYTMKRKIDRLQAAISRWKDKVTKDVASHEIKARELIIAKKDIFMQVKSMKRAIHSTRNQERQNLLQLTTDARKAKVYMESRLSRAHRILKRLDFIKELEKTHEIVAFYFPSKVDDDVHMSLEDMKTKTYLEKSERRHMEIRSGNKNDIDNDACWSHMIRFWKKHNSVVSELNTIRNEHERLREESKTLLVGFMIFNVHKK